MITLNAIAKRLEEFATNHFFVKSYSFGSPDDVDLDKFEDFPLMHVVYTGSDYDERTKTFSFEVYVFDRPNREEQMTTHQREVVSDAQMCLEDIVADIANGGNVFLFSEDYSVDNAGITPLIDERSNLLAGALMDLTISVPYQRDACNLPIDGVSPEGGEIVYARRGLLRMLTQDGSVDVTSVNTIKVTNGTLTDDGNGVVSLDITGGTGAVDSVNGQTGAVVLDADDISDASTTNKFTTQAEIDKLAGIEAGAQVNDVTSVAGKTGAVTLDTDDVTEATNLYYTNDRVDAWLQSGNVTEVDIEGRGIITWNSDDGTLDVAYSNGVTLQVGQEEHFYGKATEAISDGDVVMFAGAQGSHTLIAKADMSATGFRPEWVMGVATQDFATNDFGYVTSFGKVRGINTDSYTEGALLWLDPDNAGRLTATEPSPPDHIVLVCANIYKHQTQGVLLVRLSHTQDTDETPEGTSNLYWTQSRFDSAFTSGIAGITSDDIADGATTVIMTTAERTKLSGIAAGAEVNVNADWNAVSGDAQILNKPTLATVATTGAYADLSGLPTIPDELADLAGTSDDITEGQTNLFLTSAERTAIANIPNQFFQVSANGSTAITLNTGDEGTYIRCTASSAVTITVPADKFQVDDEIIIEQAGTGQVTITAGASVTLNNSAANTAKTAERYSVVGLKCVASNTFTLTGERELV